MPMEAPTWQTNTAPPTLEPHVLALYQAVITHLPEPPNVAVVQERHPLPESWPVILSAVNTGRGGYLQSVEVSDGTHTVHCTTTVPEVANRLVSLEPGTVIHVLGGEVRYSEAHRAYVLDVENVCTLKEYDTLLKQRQAAADERAEQQRQWLEETYGDTLAAHSDLPTTQAE